jgi:hypothetical protein
MSPTAKLVSIGFVAPALAFALMSVAWSFIFVALAVLGYPIMVVLTLALLFPLGCMARETLPSKCRRSYFSQRHGSVLPSHSMCIQHEL